MTGTGRVLPVMISVSRHSTESFMTLEPSCLLMLSKPAFKHCLGGSPEIAYQLIAQLAHQVRWSTKTVNELRGAAVVIAKLRAHGREG